MATHGLVELGEVVTMLENCAPGATGRPFGKHRMLFSWQGRVVLLPLGSHSDRGRRQARAELERGHVRKLIRALDVPRECAEQWLPIFRGELVR